MFSFFENQPTLSEIGTMGVDHFVKAFQLSDGSIINCFIYDTCGQERYNSINLTYYKKADAVLLVYDISNIKSFKKISDFYVDKIKECCKENIPILLLGNKTDLENKRQVTKEMGIELALKEKYEFKESSCIENKNVAGAFESLVENWNFKRHKIEKIVKNNILKANTDDNSIFSYVPNSRETITLNYKHHRVSKSKLKKCCSSLKIK